MLICFMLPWKARFKADGYFDRNQLTGSMCSGLNVVEELWAGVLSGVVKGVGFGYFVFVYKECSTE